MKNIRFIKHDVDISSILAQLHQYPEDWGAQRKVDGVHDLVNEYGFPKLDVGMLQLIMGGVHNLDEYVGDTEICIPTPALEHHTSILDFLEDNFPSGGISRCGFLSIPVGGVVGEHIDFGTYYLTRDRYHLCIQGTYDYTVGGETVRVKPGDFLWFNNKVMHGTKNIGNDVRVSFVFDVVHNKDNP